ncbi:hypothetical protein [Shimia biformata]|uniref:hypothetical protein n=1 Tax=Shimia biformata TaxID=1294299 RepID=UPI0019502FD5|nr:hypothetical protein [Shimia biformata]
MKSTPLRALGFGASFVFVATHQAFAEDTDSQDLALGLAGASESGLSWEGEIELGNETILRSDNAAREGGAYYGIGSVDAAYSFGNGIAIFGGATVEELENGSGDTGYGAYVHELGVEIDLGSTALQVGKVSPRFGTAFNETAGYFGGSLAEDYELTEQVGVLAAIDMGAAGTLSLGAFYADNTFLSESVGFNRGRNSTTDGGAGNTGKLNNFSIQWQKEFGDTRVWAGARHLSAGAGDVSDETGGFVTVAHSFGSTFDLFAEVAAFEGFGGTADDATYATLNGVYYVGDWSLSGTIARREVTSTGITDLVSVGAEYELSNGATLGGALAFVDEAGTKDTVLGLNIVIPLGG